LAENRRTTDGFSLVEVLIATTVLVAALAGLAQLFGVASGANSSAKATTYATILAQQKMEQLRSLAFAVDADGHPVTDVDTDTTSVNEVPTGGTGLRPSPAGALTENSVGYVDYLDAAGESLGGLAALPPSGARYVRRWSIDPLPSNPRDTVVLQVVVALVRDRAPAGLRIGALPRLPDEVRIVSVRTRNVQ
jgi:type II secretory pathway pseudopilin PulG